MKTRRRIRSTIRWSGAAVTVLLLIVWVGSAWYWSRFDNPILDVGVGDGRVCFCLYESTPEPSGVSWLSSQLLVLRDKPSFQLWFDCFPAASTSGVSWTELHVPIWFIILLTATPTFLIWRHDRKHPPGTCPKCGYSRTGLPADRACPECGKSVTPTSVEKS